MMERVRTRRLEEGDKKVNKEEGKNTVKKQWKRRHE
jgi:hypothetical protein